MNAPIQTDRLTVHDLTRDELLSLMQDNHIRIRQSQLLSVKHRSASERCQAALDKIAALSAEEVRAFDAFLAENNPRRKAQLQIAHIDARAKYDRARRGYDAAEKEATRLWQLLESVWNTEDLERQS